MGLFKDLKFFMDFRKLEKQIGNVNISKNPLVHLIGGEKSYGKAAPHDFNNFVENFNSWAFACGYRNAFSLAKVPLKLYKRVAAGGETELEEITQHVFLDMMRNVNPYFNQFELKALTSLFLDSTGNAYWWVVKNQLGVPTYLWNIPANWMKVVPSEEEFIAGYIMTVPGRGTRVPFPADEIIHFKFPSIFSLYYGCPPMYGAAYDVDLNKEVKTYGINFFMNNAQPSGVLQTENTLTKESYERLKLAWDLKYKGSKNAGKMAILEAGLKYQKVGDSLKDMKLADTNREIRDSILAAFGVPASKLGLVEDVNRANAEANDYTYQKETILPRLVLIEEKLNEKLMPMYDAGLVCKFDNPVPEDKEFRLKEQREHIHTGYSSIDEERQNDGLDPLDLPETEVPLIPFNLTPAGTPVEPIDNPPEKAIMEKSARRRKKWEMFATMIAPQERMYAATMKRFFASQRRQVETNINKLRSIKDYKVKDGIDADIMFPINEENERLREYSLPHIDEAYTSGLRLGFQEVNATIDFTVLRPNIIRVVNERVGFVAEKINAGTAELLADAINEGIKRGESMDLIAQRIQGVYDFCEDYRSMRIARTEVVGATNVGQLDAYEKNGIEHKEWLTARDERVRDSHLIDGQTVEVAGQFKLNSGVLISAPGDRAGNAPAGELINCRCTVAAVRKKKE